MNLENNKKIIIFYVLNILKEYSDGEHLLTYRQIVDKISLIYGIRPDVKSIANNIDTLISAGFEIEKYGWKGCCLTYRNFDSGELMYLVDAINSSKAITAKQAKELIERLTKDCSKYEKKNYMSVQKVDTISKAKNKELFYVIEILGKAIEQQRKVSFNYNEYKITKELKPRFEGKEFIINPYFMVNSRGKYYLVCNYDKYNDISNYKIECISNVKILDEPIKDINSLNNMENFSMKDYIDEHIYMTNGFSVKARLLLKEKKYINDIIDWFGDNIDICEKSHQQIYVDLTVNEQALIYWALQYGEHIEVIEPQDTRTKIKDIAEIILKKYNV